MAQIGPSISITSIGPGGVRQIGYSNFFVVGQTPWGIDGTFQICDSFQAFLRLYGGLSKISSVTTGTTADTYSSETNAAVSMPYNAVKAYFQEKQSNSPGVLYFCRAVASSSGPTAANKTFADAVGTNNTTVTSKWKGTSGSTTQVSIVNPSPTQAQWVGGQAGTVAVSGTSTVTGTGTAFAASMVGNGIQFNGQNFTILTYTSATSITVGPTPSFTLSGLSYSFAQPSCQLKFFFPQANITEYYDITNANDAANASKKSVLATIALPAGGQLPITAAASKLASGVAATADTYAATDADLVGTTTAAGVKTGLQVFNDQKLGTGFVAIPGKYTSTIRTGINTHCSTFFREGLLGAPSGLNLTTVVSDLGSQNGPDLAYYWPQLWVQDDGSQNGGQILVDPVGHVAGLGARMDRDYGGPQKSPAGLTHPLVSAIDVERASGSFMELCDDTGSQTLADSLINTIRIKGNPGGVAVWGMRTLSQDNRYRQVPVRRILHLIYLTTFLTLEGYTFEPFDGQGRLFSRVKGDLDLFLESLVRAGTLYGSSPGKDPQSTDAYYVVCDPSNNPGTAISQGELHVDVQFVPAFNAERITENLSLVIPGLVGRSQ